MQTVKKYYVSITYSDDTHKTVGPFSSYSSARDYAMNEGDHVLEYEVF